MVVHIAEFTCGSISQQQKQYLESSFPSVSRTTYSLNFIPIDLLNCLEVVHHASNILCKQRFKAHYTLLCSHETPAEVLCSAP